MTAPAATFYAPATPYATLADIALCGCSDLTFNPEAPTTGDGPLLTAALMWASRRTFLATGQRFFGLTESTIRPCRARCDQLVPWGVFPYGFPWDTWPSMGVFDAWGSGFVPVWACNCESDSSCSCTDWDRIPLPLLPVRAVTEVKIDGAVFDSSKYAVTEAAWLLRIDGDPWPSCQAVELPDTQPGTWSVTWQHSLDLPPEAVPLVALYACQLAQRCKGGDCTLPQGIQVSHRVGVDFVVAEPAAYRASGLTGFAPLDDWIGVLNGGHTQEPPRLYRPRHGYGGSTLERP